MAKEKAKPKVVKEEHLDEIWDVIDEVQKNIDYLNDKVQRLLTRMGIES